MQCPRCQHENPAGQRFCGACGTLLQDPFGSTQPATSYTDLQHALTEALAQQTATSEILRVISRSPTDVQPVFDTIVESAVRLCDGLFSALYRFDGELIHHVAQHNYSPEALNAARRAFPVRPSRATGVGRAVLERAIVHIPDVEVDPQYRGVVSRAIGARSVLSVPTLREGAPIGVIVVARAEPGPFSDNEIALLQTFADQAVIAVENVRLFTELQASNRELTTALDTQTATSDILRVISRSQTNVQPVFESIADSVMRLFAPHSAVVLRYDGEFLRLAAARGGRSSERMLKRLQAPRHPEESRISGQAILTRTVRQIVDVEADTSLVPEIVEIAREVGWRSAIYVPMLRGDDAVGVIGVHRAQPGAFAPADIAVLQTFADQAVIAIENVRLFNETKEALERQTATSSSSRQSSSWFHQPQDGQGAWAHHPADASAAGRPGYRMMNRRTFITMVGGNILASQRTTGAQAGKVWRIGYLTQSPPSDGAQARLLASFRGGLRDLGYVEGQNLVIEHRWAGGRVERLPELVAELVRLKPDVLVVTGTPQAQAAKRATSTIPIVMTSIGDPVVSGLIATLARPGGNVTGLTNLSVGLAAKQLELFKEAVPRLARVAAMHNPANPRRP